MRRRLVVAGIVAFAAASLVVGRGLVGPAAGPVERLAPQRLAGDADRGAAAVVDSVAPVPPGGGGGAPVPFAPKVVRTATVDVRVRSFATAWERAGQVASRHGGLVASSSAETSGERLARGTITIRVPADRLDAAVRDMRGLGTLVRQSSSANDVSGQIVDFDARLRSLHAQEQSLLALLKDAQGVSQVLEVRTRLDEVRGQIESLQSQRELLQSQVDLATLQASIFEPGAQAEVTPPGRFALAWERAVDVLATIVAGALVVAAAVVPIGAFVAIAWAVVRLARRRTPSSPAASA